MVTWQLVKGNTQTTTLLSYQEGKDLAMVLESNTISNGKQNKKKNNKKTKHLRNASCTGQLLEEYKNGRPCPETTHMPIAGGLFLVALDVPQELSLASSFLSSLSGTTLLFPLITPPSTIAGSGSLPCLVV